MTRDGHDGAAAGCKDKHAAKGPSLPNGSRRHMLLHATRTFTTGKKMSDQQSQAPTMHPEPFGRGMAIDAPA